MFKKIFSFYLLLTVLTVFAEEYTGIVERGKSGNLAFENPGRIVYLRPIGQFAVAGVYDENNNIIKKGDLIAQQDTNLQEAKIKSTEAQLAGAKATMEEKKSEFERVSKLAEKNISSQKAFDTAKKDLETSSAEVKKLEANLRTEQYNLEACYLRAPFDGEIESHLYSEGTWVDHGKDVITLSVFTVVRIKVALPEDVTRKIALSDTIEIIAPNGERLPVWFEDTSVLSDSVTLLARNFAVPVTTLNEEQKKLPKVSKLTFVAKLRDEDANKTVWVPTDAIFTDQDCSYIWAASSQKLNIAPKPIEKEFIAKKVMVKPGERYRNLGIYRYRDILNPGSLAVYDIIVIDPPKGLKDGDKVAYQPQRWLFRPGDKVKVSITHN